jgi:hypothetical protein
MRELPYEERLRKLGLPTLLYRRERERADMVQTYKLLHNQEDINPSQVLKKANPGTTRAEEHTHTVHAKKNFRHRIVNNWNQLPADVVSSSSINSFKSQLNKFWRNKPNKFSH